MDKDKVLVFHYNHGYELVEYGRWTFSDYAVHYLSPYIFEDEDGNTVDESGHFLFGKDEENGVYRTNDVDGTYFDDLFRIRYKVSGEAGEETFSSELDLQDRLNELMQLLPDTDVSLGTVSQWNKAREAGGEYIRVYEYEVINDEQ